MSFTLQLVIRLLVAGLLGAVIGYERELRAKGAGVRTHVLVALGAALFMIISQHGFAGAPRFDAARVAAGVVSGIGFLGGGIIMKKNHVSGLTTAAGLWVTGAIGMGAGCGLYLMAGLCTFLVLFCLEVLNAYAIKFGQREVDVVLSSENELSLVNAVEELGKQAGHFHLYKENGLYKVAVNMRVSKRETPLELMTRLKKLPDVALDSME
ncbi:MAG: MgtC/SapB family protein [Bacteroidales bacterium]|nr:MgtC/SapB family protein [Bacteroidales bacterium]